MADTALVNLVSATGVYDNLPTTLTSLAITTQLVSGLTIVKTADKEVWADGLLTYTIEIANDASNASAYTGVTLTDILDITKITLVADSVEIDGTTASYTYDDTTGTLTVDLPDIAVGESVEVTFQVQKNS